MPGKGARHGQPNGYKRLPDYPKSIDEEPGGASNGTVTVKSMLHRTDTT